MSQDPGIWERSTDRARTVFRQAQQEAVEAQLGYIGVMEILRAVKKVDPTAFELFLILDEHFKFS